MMKKTKRKIKHFGIATISTVILTILVVYGIGIIPYRVEAMSYKIPTITSIKQTWEKIFPVKIVEPISIQNPIIIPEWEKILIEPTPITRPTPVVSEPEPIARPTPVVSEPEPIARPTPVVSEPEPIARPTPVVSEPTPIARPMPVTKPIPVDGEQVPVDSKPKPTDSISIPQDPIIEYKQPVVVFEEPEVPDFMPGWLVWWEIVLPINTGSSEIIMTDIQKNIQKYRAYKTRLIEKFVRVSPGNEAWSNLVASKRKAFVGRNSEYIDFGDTMGLMWFYLGALATEYRLLKNEWGAVDQTLRQLMYAMNALERLDLNAEKYFWWWNMRNGFFIRDDAPSYYYPTCMSSGYPNNNFWAHFGSDITKIGYNYGNCDIRNNEMSQDQAWALMLWLSLVKKLMNEGTLHFAWESYNFAQKAKDMTERIIRYMHVTEKRKITPRTTITIKRRRIKNPVTGNLVKRWAMWWPDVMAWFAYGFAKAWWWIVEKNLDRKNNVDVEREFSKSIFQNMKNGNINKLQELLAKAGMQINTYSLFWWYILWTIANIRGSDVVHLTKDVYDFMGMLQYVLHNDTTTKQKLVNRKTFFQNQINTAPVEWPYNFGWGDRPVSYDWTSQNLLWDPEERGTIPTSNNNLMRQRVGEYNGLDYMLLHNLFLLTYKDSLENFVFAK